MSRIKDLKGQSINGINILSEAGRSNFGKTKWLCLCHCGKQFIAISGNLISEGTKSCGCTNLKNLTKHGDHKTHFYGCWRDMRHRCRNVNMPEYKNYGGRGISVCDRWQDYLKFKEDMFPGYKQGLTIDRINVNGNYELGNCRWATNQEQCRNQRRNVFLDTEFGRITIAEAAEKYGLKHLTIRSRINRGVALKDLFLPVTGIPWNKKK